MKKAIHPARVLLLMILSLSSAAQAAVPMPEWMQTENKAIQPPSKMTEDEQIECTEAILLEVNRHFKTSFTRNDVTPIQMPNWKHSEMGFMRGGGFNIRIVKEIAHDEADEKKLKPGRFSDLKTLLELGDQPSLHMPKAVDGKRMFIETESEDQSTKSYDFIAHSDSAYAFLPLGTFLHLFRDVIGAKNRRPCPVEHGLREILLRE